MHRAGWKDGGRQEKLWRASLRDYAMPKLGERAVDRIQTADVMAVLLPIWNQKRVTAQRIRRRISAVMRWAVAQGYREDNPELWSKVGDDMIRRRRGFRFRRPGCRR